MTIPYSKRSESIEDSWFVSLSTLVPTTNAKSWTPLFKARILHSVQIDTPLTSRARALWRSFFLPFYRPTQSLCACLSSRRHIYDMSHSIQTFLLFIYIFKSTKRVGKSNIKAPTDTSKCRLTTSEDAWVVFTR